MLSTLTLLRDLSLAIDYGLDDDELEDEELRGEAQAQVGFGLVCLWSRVWARVRPMRRWSLGCCLCYGAQCPCMIGRTPRPARMGLRMTSVC